MDDDRLQYLFDNILLLGNSEDKNSLQAALGKSRAVRDFLDDAR
jgi:hypothetical protein